MIDDPEDEAFNEIERQAKQRKEAVKAAIEAEKAFPNPHYRDESGITVRDYFAAKAMQALIDNDSLFSEIPAQAYALADAMMKAREA